MASSGKQIEAGSRLLRTLGFRQNAATACNDRVGSEHDGAGITPSVEYGGGFDAAQALGQRARQLAGSRILIDVGSDDRVRFDADLTE